MSTNPRGNAGILACAWKNSHLSVGSVVALITLIDNAYTPSVIYVQYKLNKTAWHEDTFQEISERKDGRSFPANPAQSPVKSPVTIPLRIRKGR